MQVFKQQAGETTINIGLKHFNEVYVIPFFSHRYLYLQY